MSGHSKWAQIKRQKGAADIKRGQTFTKIANAITIAVRQGGGISDPSSNFRLRLAIEKARSVNMPKENIERAVKRAFAGKDTEAVEEVVYEGFAPGKVAVIVDVATTNKQRIASEIKNIFDKNGATLARPGSVSYQYEQKGVITVRKNGKTMDEIFLVASDAGAQDLEEIGEEVLIYTKPEELTKVKEVLSQALLVVDAQLTRKPTATVKITDRELAGKVVSFIEKLEQLDDVQKVYANFDIKASKNEVLKNT